MIEQNLPGQCPECGTEMDLDDLKSIGEYPIGGFRNIMKPNQTHAAIYECPKCYAKSCCHADESLKDFVKRRAVA